MAGKRIGRNYQARATPGPLSSIESITEMARLPYPFAIDPQAGSKEMNVMTLQPQVYIAYTRYLPQQMVYIQGKQASKVYLIQARRELYDP